MAKDKELVSPENVTPKKADIAHVKALHGKLKDVSKQYNKDKFLLYKHIWEMHQLKGWKVLGYESDSEYLKDQFPNEQIGDHTWREGSRVYGQFMAQLNSSKSVDHREAGEKVVEMLESVYHQVGDNVSYVGEVARHQFIGDTPKETERNLKAIGDTYKDSENAKDFKVKLAKKFEKLNRNASEANARPGKNSGGQINMLFKVDAAQYETITAAFESLSVSLGTRQAFADMSNDDRGRLLALLALEISTNKEAVAVMDDKSKRSAAATHIKHAYSLITGLSPTDTRVKALATDFSACIERAAEGESDDEEAADEE